MRMIGILLLLALPLGCATLVRGNETVITFHSAPAGASFRVVEPDGSTTYEGTTPATVSLSTRGGYFRPASYTVLTRLEGYRSKRTEIRAEFDGLLFGNVPLLLPGVVGFLFVDPYTGAMWAFDRNHVIRLRREGPQPEPAGLPDARSDELTFAECFDSCVRLVSNTENECVNLCGSE
jgi:hypothetical protein